MIKRMGGGSQKDMKVFEIMEVMALHMAEW